MMKKYVSILIMGMLFTIEVLSQDISPKDNPPVRVFYSQEEKDEKIKLLQEKINALEADGSAAKKETMARYYKKLESYKNAIIVSNTDPNRKEFIFMTQEHKNANIKAMEERIKVRESQGFSKEKIQKYYDRLEMYKNAKVTNVNHPPFPVEKDPIVEE